MIGVVAKLQEKLKQVAAGQVAPQATNVKASPRDAMARVCCEGVVKLWGLLKRLRWRISRRVWLGVKNGGKQMTGAMMGTLLLAHARP